MFLISIHYFIKLKLAFCWPLLNVTVTVVVLKFVASHLDFDYFYYTEKCAYFQEEGFHVANTSFHVSLSQFNPIHQGSNIWSGRCLGLYLTLSGMHLIKGVTKEILEEVTMVKEETISYKFSDMKYLIRE